MAEYEVLLAGLLLVETLKVSYLEVESDLLLVNQLKWEYNAKQENMKRYLTEVRKRITKLKGFEIR